jgi:hypothetical protein
VEHVEEGGPSNKKCDVESFRERSCECATGGGTTTDSQLVHVLMEFRFRQACRGHKPDSTDRPVGHARFVCTEGHARFCLWYVSICGLSRTASEQNGMSR